MNYTQKRQMSIRNKLFGAISMLLVASIMMVSTTYAWFTLSTAPEVQGITTTVGSNGNLEIALSPTDGDSDSITSAMGDSDKSWAIKNLTWGNLLNLSDTSYGLGGISLLPAQLSISDSGLTTAPLKTPTYGADGRISQLEANTAYGKYTNQGYEVDSAFRGVRAIGTSSTMTEYQITFNNYLAKMGTDAAAARSLAESSLRNNGSKLADMAVSHATVSGTDGNNYKEYVTAMENVVTTMLEANAKLKDSIYAGAVAAVASNFSGNDHAMYTVAMNMVNNNATLEELMVAAQKANWVDEADHSKGIEVPTADIGNNPLGMAYNAWKLINTNLSEANTAIATLKQDDDVRWDEASTVLTKMMNTEGVKVNNKNLTELKELASWYLADRINPGEENYQKQQDAITFVNSMLRNIEVQLDARSGVYGDMASMVGNLSATIGLNVSYAGVTLKDAPATIKTTNASPSDSGTMGRARTTLANLGALQTNDSTSTGMLNETYGYMVDFYFRTNANGSKLQLQSDAAQRVYESSQSQATQGSGSTMTFTTGTISVQAVENLMDCIRVVFVDPTNNAVFGIAKLDATTIAHAGNSDGTTAVTAKLKLYDYTINADGSLTLSAPKTSAALCDMPTNTAKAVSALVYLDGDQVTNADVANAATAMTGTMNLQFSSSAELVPMENAALENMADNSGSGSGNNQQPALTATTVTLQGEASTVTVTGYKTAESQSAEPQTVTLDGTNPQTVTVYTGTSVDYTVTVGDGFAVTQDPTHTWTVATAPANP
ncbi:MAG: hypothetical protein E7457_02800 [Ruminococcaceae bacterium]|nr:hypothetical protein [Oscillospiraceae bacterium]